MAWPWEMGRLIWLQGHSRENFGESSARAENATYTGYRYLWSVNVYRYRYYSVEAGADGVLC
jgi:hypothetical protein